MIPIPKTLESHLQRTVTTHCFAWIIRRQDGVALGFTDHDRPLLVSDVMCELQTGMTGSEAATALGLSIDSAEIEGALSSLAIDRADIERGLYDGATVETYLVNWSLPGDNVLLRRSGIGKIACSDGKFTAELKSAAAGLNKIHGRRVMRNCDAELGDRRCGVNAADPRYFAEGRVIQTDDAAFLVTGLEHFRSGWFDNGHLTWDSGANAGRTTVVVSHAANRIALRDIPTDPVAVGDTFRIIAGCDKSFAQCKAKFANGVSFRGFPHLPGNDAAYAYVSGGDEFDGGPLVP
ncbi:hypothetical protein ATN84_00245 [Paramesorhizobium deserti]|uniref:Bacteriophage phiJL001 Gp84 C-terminal domain-containing protein n=1 Tax=Paramesorhizobium deserti TaxID=1494590 RepID=A0A135HYJ1_9HYPH|nr:DUF2163 domain-containing protein [Paramesorhizobium deserti]KXF78274.1 hypothetical protein ATN84_00245 [Paramesorhizobium deserti]